uniref:Uncharacterized protein n=1 Tax=Anguilla anguilla TaxID=7936 RepID=A0A0E9TGU5_ANGAN
MKPSQRHICTVMGTVGSPLLQRFQTAVAHWNIQCGHPRHSGAGSISFFPASPVLCPWLYFLHPFSRYSACLAAFLLPITVNEGWFAASQIVSANPTVH